MIYWPLVAVVGIVCFLAGYVTQILWKTATGLCFDEHDLSAAYQRGVRHGRAIKSLDEVVK